VTVITVERAAMRQVLWQRKPVPGRANFDQPPTEDVWGHIHDG